MVSILRGLVLNPMLVAFARGLLEAIVLLTILSLIEFLGVTGNLPDWLQPYSGIAILALRQLEGVADQIDPAKQRRRDTLRQAAEDPASHPIQPGDVPTGTQAETDFPPLAPRE